jgi:adenine C2-methylase RlmN of 23S rRNA A2503 and tRNA A37
MSSVKHAYQKALIKEINDLVRHAEELVEWFTNRKKEHDITEHVYFENTAVLENEKCCLHNFQRELERMDPEDYASVEDMIDDIKARFKRIVSACGFVKCAYLFAEHKIDKVYDQYVSPKSPPGKHA